MNPTPEKRWSDDEIIAGLKANDGRVYLAARAIGCHPDTIYERSKTTRAIRDVLDQSRGELVDLGETALKRAVVAGEGWAVCFALKTLGKDRGYVERVEQRHGGEDGGAIPIRVVEVVKSTGSHEPLPDQPRQTDAASPPRPDASLGK